ncbi:ABC transporter permease [Bacillus carboniphilus]|uniref:ABC transporter permease n=1 Tax=Bacillus carboniphilus TaxID=86663 RepID=A0ABN0WK06_9BACI
MKIASLLQVEWLKMKKTNVWLLSLLSPAIATIAGLNMNFPNSPEPWHDVLGIMVLVHALLFFPLLVGVYSAFVCRFEHLDGGWKQLLSLPVTRLSVIFSKWLVVMGLLTVTQIILLAGCMTIGMIKGFGSPFPWELAIQFLIGGTLACTPLVILQMWFSTIWSSFAAPFTIAVIFTLPNILVANSEDFAPYYPWVQPFFAMFPSGENASFYVSQTTLWTVILISTIVFSLIGSIYIKRKVF